MSPFKQDIIKILLDKALLGLIAAAFGFYLSRLLEDYRTRNAYYLLLSKERVEAFRKVIEVVSEHYQGITAVLRVVKAALEERRRLSDEEVKPALEHIERYKNFAQQLSPHIPFMSADLFDLFLAYHGETIKIAQVVNRTGPVSDLPDQEKIEELFIAFVHSCSMAMTIPEPPIRRG
jgi:hypothetical protein